MKKKINAAPAKSQTQPRQYPDNERFGRFYSEDTPETSFPTLTPKEEEARNRATD